MTGKNSHRLNRIFRKNTNKVSTRDFKEKSSLLSVEESFGISANTLQKIVAGLTDEEKKLAVLGAEPVALDEEAAKKRQEKFGALPATAAQQQQGTALTAEELEAMQKRADRFKGTEVTATAEDAGAIAEALKKRMDRFGSAPSGEATNAPQPDTAAIAEALKKRMDRFGAAATSTAASGPSATAAPQLSEADREAAERRAKRFA